MGKLREAQGPSASPFIGQLWEAETLFKPPRVFLSSMTTETDWPDRILVEFRESSSASPWDDCTVTEEGPEETVRRC